LSRGIRKAFGFMRGNFLVLTVTQILERFFRSMVMPYASLYVLALGGMSAQIGMINSLRPLAGLFVFPLAGYFTDRAGRVRLIALARFLSGATLMIYVLAPSWEWIALAALLQGFMVFQFPPTSAIIADSLNPEKRGTGIATMNTLASSLAMFSPYVAGLVLDSYGAVFGMKVLYGLLAAASFISAMVNLRYLKETRTGASDGEPRTGIWEIFRGAYGGIPSMLRRLPRTTRALGAIITLTFVANAISSPFWVVYAVERIGLSSVEWGLILLVEAALRTVLYIPAGMLVDRYGRAKSLIASLAISLVSIPLFVFSTRFVEVLLIRMAVALVNVLFSPACSALIADTVPRDIRGRVMAAFGRGTILVGASGGGTGGPGMGFLITLPVMVASLIGGILYAMDPAYPWFFVLVTTIISLATSAFFVRDPQEAEI
jgi:MFS family permease